MKRLVQVPLIVFIAALLLLACSQPEEIPLTIYEQLERYVATIALPDQNLVPIKETFPLQVPPTAALEIPTHYSGHAIWMQDLVMLPQEQLIAVNYQYKQIREDGAPSPVGKLDYQVAVIYEFEPQAFCNSPVIDLRINHFSVADGSFIMLPDGTLMQRNRYLVNQC